MPVLASFPEQFFDISSPIDDRFVILAGGLDPMNGQRSQYRATVARFDYAAGRIEWQTDIEKSYPFRAVAQTPSLVAAVLPQTFVGEPIGLFQFEMASGQSLPATHDVSGWKIKYVDTRQSQFSFSWVFNEKSYLRVVEREATLAEMVFPYPSTGGGKTLERVFAVDSADHLAIFSFVEGTEVCYSIERWRLNSTVPSWSAQTRLSNAVRNESVLLMWDNVGRKLDVEIFSIADGNRQAAVRFSLPDVIAITPMNATTYAVLTRAGASVMDIGGKRPKKLAGLSDKEILNFGALSVDARAGKLLVATAGNFQRPGTKLVLVDL